MRTQMQNDALDSLKYFVVKVGELPQHVRLTPVNHNDLCAIIDMLVCVLEESKDEETSEH